MHTGGGEDWQQPLGLDLLAPPIYDWSTACSKKQTITVHNEYISIVLDLLQIYLNVIKKILGGDLYWILVGIFFGVYQYTKFTLINSVW